MAGQLQVLLREQGIEIPKPQIIAGTGWTTADLALAIDARNPQGPFQLVTLLIGVNNQFQGLPVDGYRSELVSLIARSIELAGGKAERVLVVSIPDWGVTPFARGRKRERIALAIDRFNQTKRAVATRAGVGFIDITDISREATQDSALIAADGLHPSDKMYRLWVQRILPFARKILDKKK